MDNSNKTRITFDQIARHPVTYALIVIVSVFWWTLDYIGDSKKEQLDREAKLYEMVIEEVRKQVQPIAKKVDTIKMDADSTFKKINDRL